MQNSQIAAMTASIVSAYAANHRATPEQLGAMISDVGAALNNAANPPAPTLANVQSNKRGRNVIRRRGGKVVGSSTQEGQQEDEQIEQQQAEQQAEQQQAETSQADVSDDDGDISDWEVDDEGNRKPPKPMFD